MKNVARGQRISRLVEEMRLMAALVEDFAVFFELLPHVLRDEVLRRRLALLFRGNWKMKLDWLGVDDGTAAMSDPDLLGGVAQLLGARSSTGWPSRSPSTRTWTSPTPIGCSLDMLESLEIEV